MSASIEIIQCPGCGARVSHRQTECEFCGGPVIIRSMSAISAFNPLQLNKYAASFRKQLADAPDDADLHMSMGMCFLRLKLYDKANEAFDKAVTDNFDSAEPYFYAAVSLLGGQKAFVAQRAAIDKAIEYLNAANMIAPSPIHHLMLAYIKADYFDRKYLNITPSAAQEFDSALAMGLTPADADSLASLLGVELPARLHP